GFQNLQGRIHLNDASSLRASSTRDRLATRAKAATPKRPTTAIAATADLQPVAFIAFDILRSGSTDWRDRPLRERRDALERLFRQTKSPMLRRSEERRVGEAGSA